MMRSPGAAFDLRVALVEEVQSAAEIFESNPTKPKTIHRCRIALKRARALAAVGSVSAPGLAEVFNDGARAIMRTLGRARQDWALEQSARAFGANVSKSARRELSELAERVEAFQRTAQPVNAEAVRAGLKDLLAIAYVWPDASPRQVERGARRLVRRARKVWRRARKAEGDIRHSWRKREKARLYAALLLGKAWPQEIPRRRKRNAKLADLLGRERDLTLVMDRLHKDWPQEGQHRGLRELHKLQKRLFRRSSKLGRRVHANGA